jgi:lipopolysaccharide/colanic/teichoic acid biosynthesis glycosyltransferase
VKRSVDLLVSALGLLVASPLLLLLAALVKGTSRGPVFFRQERMGRGFRPFGIYKFRTMVEDAPRQGGPITFGRDPRITRVGRFLRATKLDEVPQLLNVLKGEMSLVGPRPEIPRYVELFRSDYEEILRVRPGITDLASIKYRHEAEILGRAADPEREYLTRVLPEKVRLGKQYARQSSLGLDVCILCKTLFSLLRTPARADFSGSEQGTRCNASMGDPFDRRA